MQKLEAIVRAAVDAAAAGDADARAWIMHLVVELKDDDKAKSWLASILAEPHTPAKEKSEQFQIVIRSTADTDDEPRQE